MAEMQAYLLSLTVTVSEKEGKVESVCENLTSEIENIKAGLQECSNSMSSNIHSFHHDGDELCVSK